MTDDDAILRRGVLRRLYIACFLCFCFIIVEVVGGMVAHSLAILSDAAHLVSDLVSFAVAILASYLATLPASQQHTYGLKRTESLGALVSMLSLALVCVGLLFEAVRRLISPPEEAVDGLLMSMIAAIGVLVNITLEFVLGVEHHVHLPGAHDHDHSHGHGHGCHDSHKDEVELGNCHGHGHQHGNGNEHEHKHGHEHEHEHEHKHGHEHEHEHEHKHGHEHEHDHHDKPANGHRNSDHDHGHNHKESPLLKSGDEDHKHSAPKGVERNVNLHAAYIHVMADLLQSVIVLIVGVIIWYKPEWEVIDPICTIVYCFVVFRSTLGVLRSAISVLLEETPPDVNWKNIYDDIAAIENVENVHDLHIWSVSHGQTALSVHCTSTDPDALCKISAVCQKHHIFHPTIQIQQDPDDCVTCTNACGCVPHDYEQEQA